MRIALLALMFLSLVALVAAAENTAPTLEVSARAVNEVVAEVAQAPSEEAPSAEQDKNAQEAGAHDEPEQSAQEPVAARSAEEEEKYQEAIDAAHDAIATTRGALGRVKDEARTVDDVLKTDVESYVKNAQPLLESENYTLAIAQAMPLLSRARSASEDKLAEALEELILEARRARANVYERQSYEGDDFERWLARVKLWWQFEVHPPTPEQEIRVVFAQIAADIRGDGQADAAPAAEKSEH